MKIAELMKKLRVNNEESKRKVKSLDKKTNDPYELFRNSFINEDSNAGTKLKIIGVTGSKGKSSVCYLVHEYLKKLGRKSILYSSIGIDNPGSFNKQASEVENPLLNEGMLLDALVGSMESKADYLILEVNEQAIKNNLTKDIPFDIRVITNIIKTHNDYFYEDYYEIKKEFFKEVAASDETVCLFSCADKEIFDDLYGINKAKKVTYMSKYVREIKGIDKELVDYQLTADKKIDSIAGLKFKIVNKSKEVEIESKLLFPHQALNITGVMAIIDSLGELDEEIFAEFIRDIKIPYRDEVIDFDGKVIMIGTSLLPAITHLAEYKEEANLILVGGAVGLGYKNWAMSVPVDKQIEERVLSIKETYEYINKYASKMYLTVSDSGATDKEALVDFQASLLRIPYEKEIDRKVAIKKAIEESGKGDIIYVFGRGGRMVMCDGYDSFKIFNDKKEVIKIVEELR